MTSREKASYACTDSDSYTIKTLLLMLQTPVNSYRNIIKGPLH